MVPFIAAGPAEGEPDVMQGVGLRLPAGAGDYAICGLSIVDADIDDHHVRNNACDPATGEKYGHHRPYSPGETVTRPGPIGAEVTLDVDQILKAAQKKAS